MGDRSAGYSASIPLSPFFTLRNQGAPRGGVQLGCRRATEGYGLGEYVLGQRLLNQMPRNATVPKQGGMALPRHTPLPTCIILPNLDAVGQTVGAF